MPLGTKTRHDCSSLGCGWSGWNFSNMCLDNFCDKWQSFKVIAFTFFVQYKKGQFGGAQFCPLPSQNRVNSDKEDVSLSLAFELFDVSCHFCYKNSHRRCSITKCVLKNFSIFTEKPLCWSLLFNKVEGLKPET